MSNVRCEISFAKELNQKLSALQKELINVRDSGYTENQCITPTVTVTYEEIKGHTRRKRLKGAVVKNIVSELERLGNKVEVSEAGTMTITKLAKDVPSEFTSYQALCQQLEALTLGIDKPSVLKEAPENSVRQNRVGNKFMDLFN